MLRERSEEELRARLRKQSRGIGVSWAPRGPGISLQQVLAWIDSVGEALVAEPQLARDRQQMIWDALHPLVADVMAVLRPDMSEADALRAAQAIHERIATMIKPGGRALQALKAEVAARNAAPLEHGEPPLSHDDALREAVETMLFTAVTQAETVKVHEVEKLRSTISRAVNGLLRRDLLGPAHKLARGQSRDADGDSGGHVIEGRERRRGATERLVACPACGRGQGLPPFVCPVCGVGVPCDAVQREPWSGIVVEMVERAGGLSGPEVERRLDAYVEVGRLRERLDALLSEVSAPEGERRAARAFLAACGAVDEVARKLGWRPPTVYGLLSRARSRHPALAAMLDPKNLRVV